MARKRKRRIVSNGVKRIKAFLLTQNFSFKEEHRIAECKNIRPLPFDFAIFYDKKLIALIEFNGIQHYQKIRKFGGKKAFVKQQLHDSIKVDFCRANNIPLLVVPYDSENIEELCEEFLNFTTLHTELRI